MVVWFPLAGAVIGALAGAVGAVAYTWGSPFVAGAIAVATALLITGAFHEDGLGDIADAFGGGTTVERRLEIMKDSRHGTYGVAAICTSIATRILAVASFPSATTLFVGLVAAHTMARGAAVASMAIFPPVGRAGLGASYSRSTTTRRGLVAAALAIIIATAATGWWVLPVLAAVAMAAAAVAWLALRKIGGVSGDVLGAIEQVAECAALVVLCGLALRHPLW